MAKFSVSREEEEEDEEDQNTSVPERMRMRCLKRRRPFEVSSAPPITTEDERESVDESEVASNPTSGSVTTSGSVSVILSDPDVLDCPICFEPLTIPVFQCDNGHISCSSCCIKVSNKCPLCFKIIGHNRCRAMEKVIESVKVPCCYVRYGCRAVVNYCKKLDHEGICIYAPCSCPFHNCIFRGSPKKLSQHMSQDHSNSVVRFRYNSLFLVPSVPNDKFVVLQEEGDGVIFILIAGKVMSVKCVEPCPENGKFTYDLIVRSSGSSIRFQSSTESITGLVDDPSPLDSLLIPAHFLHSSGHLKLELCIWSKDASCTDIIQSIGDA
ncbi:hypothetical protein Ancab_006370 [Ancistrocladus abbreviatus]